MLQITINNCDVLRCMMNRLILLFLCLVGLSGCEQYNKLVKEPDYQSTASDNFAYDLLDPDKKYFLGYSLEEISGLTYIGKNQLGCVQDESGKLYIYDRKKKSVVRRIKFAKGGDYEGVEVVNQMAYVIKSNGTLYKFSIDDDDKPNVDIIETGFSKENDIEGLGYHPEMGKLLICCKNKGDYGDQKIKGKAIYTFDLVTEKVDPKPLFVIKKSDIKDFLDSVGRNEKEVGFQPSGIAFHPKENRYYIIASAGKALIVLDENFNVMEFVRIRPKVLKQPEGICFSPDGRMYISSEGDGDDGYLLKFEYLR